MTLGLVFRPTSEGMTLKRAFRPARDGMSLNASKLPGAVAGGVGTAHGRFELGLGDGIASLRDLRRAQSAQGLLGAVCFDRRTSASA